MATANDAANQPGDVSASFHRHLYNLFFTTTDWTVTPDTTISADQSIHSTTSNIRNIRDENNPLLSSVVEIEFSGNGPTVSKNTLVDVLSTMALVGYVNEIQTSLGMNTVTYGTLEEAIMVYSKSSRYAPKYFFAEHTKYSHRTDPYYEYSQSDDYPRLYYDHHHFCTNPYIITPLIYHIVQGNVPRVRYLLKCGANPSLPSNIGLTPLMYAVRMGEEQIVQTLVEHPHTDVNACITLPSGGSHYMETFEDFQAHIRDDSTDGSIHEQTFIPFVVNDLPYIYRYYLPSTGSPLLFAIMMGNEQIVETLLNHPDISFFCRGYPVLHAAIWINNYDICQRIITKAVQLRINLNTMDMFGLTPFHIAIARAYSSRSLRIIELLCKNGFDVNYRDYINETPIHTVFLHYGIQKDYDPLVRNNDIGLFGSEIIKLLLNYQANPNLLYERSDLDDLYHNEASMIIRRWRYRGPPDNNNALLPNGNFPNNNNNPGIARPLPGPRRHHNHPHQQRRRRRGGRFDGGTVLPDHAEGEGRLSSFSPLHMVATLDSSWEKAALYLLQAGADIQAMDSQGRTPIHLAILSAIAYKGPSSSSFYHAQPLQSSKEDTWGIGGSSASDEYDMCFVEFLQDNLTPFFFLADNENLTKLCGNNNSSTQAPPPPPPRTLIHNHTVLSRLLHPPSLGVPANQGKSSSSIIIPSIERVKFCLRQKDEKGYLPIHYLIDNDTLSEDDEPDELGEVGNISSYECLLKVLYLFGSPLDTKLPNGYNFLQYCLINKHRYGPTVIPLLLEWNSSLVKDRTPDGKTVLHLAMEQISYRYRSIGKLSLTRLVEKCLANGIDINSGDFYSYTPLHYLIRDICVGKRIYESDRMLQTRLNETFIVSLTLLLENGANVMATDRNGNTILHQLVRSRRMNYTRLRLVFLFMTNYGCSMFQRNSKNISPLKYFSNTHDKMFQVFLEACYNKDDIHQCSLYYQYLDDNPTDINNSDSYPQKGLLSAKQLYQELCSEPGIFPFFENFNRPENLEIDNDRIVDYLVYTNNKSRSELIWELWYRWDIPLSPFMIYNVLSTMNVPSCEIYDTKTMSNRYGIRTFCEFIAVSPLKSFRVCFPFVCVLLCLSSPLILSISYRVLSLAILLLFQYVSYLMVTTGSILWTILLGIGRIMWYCSIGLVWKSNPMIEPLSTVLPILNTTTDTISNGTTLSDDTVPSVPESSYLLSTMFMFMVGTVKYIGQSIFNSIVWIILSVYSIFLKSWGILSPDISNDYLVGPSLTSSFFRNQTWNYYYPAVTSNLMRAVRFSNHAEFYSMFINRTQDLRNDLYHALLPKTTAMNFTSSDPVDYNNNNGYRVHNYTVDDHTSMDILLNLMPISPLEPYANASPLRIYYALHYNDILLLTTIRWIVLLIVVILWYYSSKYVGTAIKDLFETSGKETVNNFRYQFYDELLPQSIQRPLQSFCFGIGILMYYLIIGCRLFGRIMKGILRNIVPFLGKCAQGIRYTVIEIRNRTRPKYKLH